MAAITSLCLSVPLSFIFSCVRCFAGLADWQQSLVLIWGNCKNPKSILKTAIYWLLSFTLTPRDQATNSLWHLIACDGNSWQPFALDTDICGLTTFVIVSLFVSLWSCWQVQTPERDHKFTQHTAKCVKKPPLAFCLTAFGFVSTTSLEWLCKRRFHFHKWGWSCLWWLYTNAICVLSFKVIALGCLNLLVFE